MVGIGYRSLIIATDAAWAVCFGSSTQLWSHSLKLSIKSLISITALVLVLTVSVSADENDILAGAAECETVVELSSWELQRVKLPPTFPPTSSRI